MAYNLIEEPWIPVRRASGKVERIAPWQVAETGDAPLRVESPRPDFDAALLEFLIGLVQTVFTPKNSDEWEQVYKQGCAPELLRKKMLVERDAFFLDGDGPRFMQDLTVHTDKKVEEKPIEGLLIDRGMAGDTSLFAKDGGFEELGLPAAAAAILTLQAFAPSGGRGQCTSLRGGGPLSVTVQDESLWGTVWCNVLLQLDLDSLPGDPKKTAMEDRIPWMGQTRTSEKGKPSTFPPDVHPLQHYWALPRRFRLVIEPERKGTCAIYGDRDVPVVRAFQSRPDGTSYDGPYRHPLTPYTVGKEGEPPNPKKGSRAGLPYRDWPLLTIGSERLLPPKVVDSFMQQERGRCAPCYRVAARGYAMDNMKPLRFVEADVPLLHVSRSVLEQLRADATGLVEASDAVRKTLLQQTKSAWKDRPGDQSGEVEARVDVAFWAATESAFHAAVRGVAAAIEKDSADDRANEKRRFLSILHGEAVRLFDALCPLDVSEGPAGLARAVRARQSAVRFTRPDNKSLLKCVGLAPAELPGTTPKRRSKKKEAKP
ncbi:MAG: type I-E CRISPR-associated protein Cse1/CasA [Deltaproteobacteria bacterium]|nr:type I-E CRISPR-associated protein Cse1/CasA [Deltaproteobacteria bacterium]